MEEKGIENVLELQAFIVLWKTLATASANSLTFLSTKTVGSSQSVVDTSPRNEQIEKSSEITRRDVIKFVVEEIRKDNGRPCRTAESTEENLEANLVMNSQCLCNVPEGCFFCKGNDFALSQVARAAAEAQEQHEAAMARAPRGPWMLRVEAAEGCARGRQAAVAEVAALQPQALAAAFQACGSVEAVTRAPHGVFFVTLADRASWEMVIKEPSIRVGGHHLKVVPSHVSPAVLISHLPESIRFETLEYEVRRYFMENGVLACVTSHWAPCIMAVKFADCDNRDMAIRMRSVRLKQWLLPIVCCEADYARILLDAAGLSGPVAPTPAAAGEEECRTEAEVEAESPLVALAEALAAAAAEAGEPLAASPQRAEGPTSPPLFSSTPLAPPPPRHLLRAAQTPPPPPPPPSPPTPPTLGALEKWRRRFASLHAQEDHMQIQLQPQLENKNHQEKGQQELQVPREQHLQQEQQELQEPREQHLQQEQQELQEPREQQELQEPREQQELQEPREHATCTPPATFAAEQGLQVACNSPEPLTLQGHQTPKELRELQMLKLPQNSLSTIEKEPMDESPASDPGVSNATFIFKSPAEGTQGSREEAPNLKGGEGHLSQGKYEDTASGNESVAASSASTGTISNNQSKQSSFTFKYREEADFQFHKSLGETTQDYKCFTKTRRGKRNRSKGNKKSVYSRTRTLPATEDTQPNDPVSKGFASDSDGKNCSIRQNKPVTYTRRNDDSGKEDEFECERTESKIEEEKWKPEVSGKNESNIQIDSVSRATRFTFSAVPPRFMENSANLSLGKTPVPQPYSAGIIQGTIDSQHLNRSFQNVDPFYDTSREIDSHQVLPNHIIHENLSVQTSSQRNSFRQQEVSRHNVFQGFSGNQTARSRNHLQEVPQQNRLRVLSKELQSVRSQLQEVPQQNGQDLPKEALSPRNWNRLQEVPQQNQYQGLFEQTSSQINLTQRQAMPEDKINQDLPEDSYQIVHGGFQGNVSNQKEMCWYNLRGPSEQSFSQICLPQQRHIPQYNGHLSVQTPSQRNAFQQQEILEYSVDRYLPGQINQSGRVPDRQMFTNIFDSREIHTQDRHQSLINTNPRPTFNQYQPSSNRNATFEDQESTNSRPFKEHRDSTLSSDFMKYQELSRQSSFIPTRIPQNGCVDENSTGLTFCGRNFPGLGENSTPAYTPGIPVRPEFSRELSTQNVYLHPMPQLGVSDEVFSRQTTFGRGIFGRRATLLPQQNAMPPIASLQPVNNLIIRGREPLHSTLTPQSFNIPQANGTEDQAHLLTQTSGSSLIDSVALACRIVAESETQQNFNHPNSNS
ncbi:Protein of unknown function [Gryllus bimaculatus]|nr:Protein of unknown function [Gryllus bimaculatus]